MGRGPGIRATGDHSIQIDFRYKGVRCRERLRLAPSPANLKYAARLKSAIEHEIATNTFDYRKHFPESPRARLFETGGSLLLRDAISEFCDSIADAVEPETLREYRADGEIIAGWFPKDKSLISLKQRDIRLELSKLPLSRQRKSNLLRPLRGTIKQALADELITSNPLAGLKFKQASSSEDTIDPFTPEEVTALGQVECGDLWTFWAWSGPRSGELIGFRWGDVDEGSETITVDRAVRRGRQKGPKTRAGQRRITLLPPARAVLRRLKRGESSDPVFTNPMTGRYWHEAKALARAFRRACRDANVRYRYPYQLRHTFATWALSSGENPLWIARQMGHKDATIIHRHYAKWMKGLDPTAGSKMVKAVLGGTKDVAKNTG